MAVPWCWRAARGREERVWNRETTGVVCREPAWSYLLTGATYMPTGWWVVPSPAFSGVRVSALRLGVPGKNSRWGREKMWQAYKRGRWCTRGERAKEHLREQGHRRHHRHVCITTGLCAPVDRCDAFVQDSRFGLVLWGAGGQG